MPSIQYGTTTIDYQIKYQKNKKDLSILTEYQKGVTVIAPPQMNNEQIASIIKQKAPAIYKQLLKLADIELEQNSHQFKSGEKITYLGRNYRLKVIKDETISNCQLHFYQGKFTATIPASISDAERIQSLHQLFKEWYINMGTKKIQQRLKLYEEKINLSPNLMTVKDQEKSWGTCTPSGNIHINWRIFTAPMRYVDYVLVHELCHLKYMDHSDDFWNLLSSLLPDYEARKEWLRIHGPNLKL
ncbi:MAG: M48 family metallopeptidase [Turicibacter sp.]|nr:M48 family metallopeptidase [Turicibacter sp.]